MVNAWSLLYDVLNGTLDKEYPIVNKKEIDEKTGLWREPDPCSDIDDMYSHHFFTEKSMKTDHNFKYHEDEILKDIQEYVSRTYQGHYTGTKHEFRKVQTI